MKVGILVGALEGRIVLGAGVCSVSAPSSSALRTSVLEDNASSAADSSAESGCLVGTDEGRSVRGG